MRDAALGRLAATPVADAFRALDAHRVGWVVLPNVVVQDPGVALSVDVALLHPQLGVALLGVLRPPAPVAAPTLRARVAELPAPAGLGRLPVVALHVPPQELPALAGRLEAAFARRPRPTSLPDNWIDAVRPLLEPASEELGDLVPRFAAVPAWLGQPFAATAGAAAVLLAFVLGAGLTWPGAKPQGPRESSAMLSRGIGSEQARSGERASVPPPTMVPAPPIAVLAGVERPDAFGGLDRGGLPVAQPFALPPAVAAPRSVPMMVPPHAGDAPVPAWLATVPALPPATTPEPTTVAGVSLPKPPIATLEPTVYAATAVPAGRVADGFPFDPGGVGLEVSASRLLPPSAAAGRPPSGPAQFDEWPDRSAPSRSVQPPAWRLPTQAAGQPFRAVPANPAFASPRPVTVGLSPAAQGSAPTVSALAGVEPRGAPRAAGRGCVDFLIRAQLEEEFSHAERMRSGRCLGDR